jgi:hypothetical protein
LGQWIALSNCKSCRNLYKEYKEEGYEIDPPCDNCFPSIHPYNKATYLVYTHCSDQVLLGMNGAVSINILAMDLIIDKLNTVKETDIEEGDKIELFHDVNNLFNIVKDSYSAQAKAKAAKNKKK